MPFKPAAKALAVALVLAGSGVAAPLFVTPALAAEATQAKANEVETALEKYFNNIPGVVSVTPDGDHYKLRIDPGPLAAQLPPDVKLSLSPLVYSLTDQGGGMWATSIADQPVDMTIDAKDKVQMRVSVASLASQGTFDANIGMFREANSQLKGISYSATNYERGKVSSKVDYTIDSATAKTTGAAAAQGIDLTSDVSVSGLSETISMPKPGPKPEGDAAMLKLGMTATSGQQTVKMAGLRWTGVLGLYRWFLEHNTKAAIEANKADLAEVVRGALPIFDTMAGTGSLSTMSVTTPVGVFGADKVNFEVGANGVVADGKVREAIGLEGLKVPEGILPPWAAPLMPQTVSLDVDASDFDLAATAKVLLDALASGDDLKGPEADQKLLKAILPSGRITIGTKTTRISGADYALSAEGSAQVGPPPAQPALDFTITMKGFDSVLKALDGFPPPMKQRAVPMMMLARGFAQTGPTGDLTWKITSSADGHLLINGQDMGPLQK